MSRICLSAAPRPSFSPGKPRARQWSEREGHSINVGYGPWFALASRRRAGGDWARYTTRLRRSARPSEHRDPHHRAGRASRLLPVAASSRATLSRWRAATASEPLRVHGGCDTGSWLSRFNRRGRRASFADPCFGRDQVPAGHTGLTWSRARVRANTYSRVKRCGPYSASWTCCRHGRSRTRRRSHRDSLARCWCEEEAAVIRWTAVAAGARLWAERRRAAAS